MKLIWRFPFWLVILVFSTSFLLNVFFSIKHRPASANLSPLFPSIIHKYDDKTYDESEGIAIVDEDRQAFVHDRPAELEANAKTTMKLHVDVLNRQKVRKTVLRKACSEFNINPSRDRNLTKEELASLQHTLVIDKYRLLYCYVPKVGCTSWKQLFLVAYGIVDIKTQRQKSMHKESKSAFKTPGQLKQTEANQKLHDCTHFLFVRNPFSRLLSAYRDKMDGRMPQDPAKCPFCHSVTQWFIKTDPKYLKGRNNTYHV